MILLHDHLDSRPHLGKDSVDIAGEFGFCDAERPHMCDYSGHGKNHRCNTAPSPEPLATSRENRN